MQTLRELQTVFATALLEQDVLPIVECVVPGAGTAASGLAIYRNTVFANLREALRTVYPVIDRLVGNEFFNYTANNYIQDYPSSAGDLNRFGEYFAEFLYDFRPAADLVYLPDTARLEWLAHNCYHASDEPALDIQKFTLLAEDDYENVYLQFNPGCALIQSDYPVHRIWLSNQSGHDDSPGIDLNEGGVQLLLLRRQGNVVLESLDPAAWAFLLALSNNASFAAACHVALNIDSKFDLQACLMFCLNNAVFVNSVAATATMN